MGDLPTGKVATTALISVSKTETLLPRCQVMHAILEATPWGADGRYGRDGYCAARGGGDRLIARGQPWGDRDQ